MMKTFALCNTKTTRRNCCSCL